MSKSWILWVKGISLSFPHPPLEGVGAAVGQGVAILRKANERRTSRNFGGSGGRGGRGGRWGGFQSRTNNNHHHSNNNLGGTNNYSNRSHSTCIPRQYGPWLKNTIYSIILWEYWCLIINWKEKNNPVSIDCYKNIYKIIINISICRQVQQQQQNNNHTNT